VPSLCHRPQGIHDIVNQTVGPAHDIFGIDSNIGYRWKEEAT